MPQAPGWIANRLSSIDLNTGKVARLLEHLAERDTPGTRKILDRVHDAAHELDLDHELLDELLGSLN